MGNQNQNPPAQGSADENSQALEQGGEVKKKKRVLTWQEKLDKNVPLNELDDVKSEADYSVRRHLREQKERAAFELRKNRSRKAAAAALENGGDE